jgi:hypothetical protein
MLLKTQMRAKTHAELAAAGLLSKSASTESITCTTPLLTSTSDLTILALDCPTATNAPDELEENEKGSPAAETYVFAPERREGE